MVAGFQEILNATILNTTGEDLKIDLINRGDRALSIIYNALGEKITPSQVSGNETGRVENNQSGQSSGDHSEHGDQGPFGNIVLPDVRQFINQSHASTSSRSSVAKINMRNAYNAVEQACLDFQQVPSDPDDTSALIESAEHLLDQWATAIRWRDRIIASEMEHYDSSEFFSLQKRIRPIIQQARQIWTKDQLSQPNGNSRKEKSIKMTPIEITKFNGDYTKWTVFKDLFEQMVNQRDLTKAEKFMYLRSNLSGEALSLIKSLRVTAENYDIA